MNATDRAAKIREFDEAAARIRAAPNFIDSFVAAMEMASFVYAFARYIEPIRRPPLCLPAPHEVSHE